MRTFLPGLVALVISATGGVAGCASSRGPGDVGLEGLALTSLEPAVIVPGSTIVLTGVAFVDAPWGETVLRLRGDAGGLAVDVTAPARFIDYDHLEVTADAALIEALGGDGALTGEAIVEVRSIEDGERYATAPLAIDLAAHRQLTPAVAEVQTGGVQFVNDELEVTGAGFLLGGAEGSSVAVVTGCVAPTAGPGAGGGCAPVGPIEVPLIPASRFERGRASFRLAPEIVGIDPGSFTGTVTIRNDHAGGAAVAGVARDVDYELVAAAIFSIGPTAASLGQYVLVDGGGFVGGEPGASTVMRLQGTFTPTGAPQGGPVDLIAVPEFVAGRTMRYVVNEEDALGRAIDLRHDTGTFAGTVTPIVAYRGREVVGDPATVTLALAAVRQVIYVDFRPSYVESLRAFGLRAVDALIRARVLEVVRDAYATINVDLRTEVPTDFALYAHVEISGPDPNGMGLFGYDNSPGKDTDNLRLYDRLGGVNAQTQEDGFPGFGGVFVESLMQFSLHPGRFGASIGGADPAFDLIFDAFRPDLDGDVVTGADLSGGLPAIDAASCPATDRRTRIACAVRVLGALIGTTMAHEIGHSLGLANPYGEGFHAPGDRPNRLMDGGGERAFLERAELMGQGPARFCTDEYTYLRSILPTAAADDLTPRPPCD